MICGLDIELGRDGAEARLRSEAMHHRFTSGTKGDEDPARRGALPMVDHAGSRLPRVTALQAEKFARPTFLPFRLTPPLEERRKLAAVDKVRSLIGKNRQALFDPVPDRIAVNLE